jgi:Protein of unknown function (DUF2934)
MGGGEPGRTPVTEEEIELLIRRRAHELWEREGRPEGFALRHWLDAERRVREEVAHAAEMRETHAAGADDAAASAASSAAASRWSRTAGSSA